MALRNLPVFSLLVLLLLSGCDVAFKSRAQKLHDQKVMASAEACHDEEPQAQALAAEALAEATSLPSLVEVSELKRVPGEKAFCYEAVVRQKAWSRYLDILRSEREAIANSVTDQNNTIPYDEKGEWIASLIDEQTAFNRTIANAEKIAPTSLQPFDANATLLQDALNARPSVAIALLECKRGSNYNCQVGFISKVRDDSDAMRYDWSFGDGEVSQRRNPLHTYGGEGDYNVTLCVYDGNDANSTATAVVRVEKSNRPVALFTTQRHAYPAQSPVDFRDLSYSQESNIVRYQWAFGDGYKSSQRHPRHIFTKAGDYIVKLEVCNAEKFCSRASKKIVIKANEALFDAEKGVAIEHYIATHGSPSEQIVKDNALMSAYRYGQVWLLAKRGKIECAVRNEGLSLNLMGQPKKCYWHERNVKQFMVELKERN